MKDEDRAEATAIIQIRSKRDEHIGFWKVLGQKTKHAICDNVERMPLWGCCLALSVWYSYLRAMLTCRSLVGRKRP